MSQFPQNPLLKTNYLTLKPCATATGFSPVRAKAEITVRTAGTIAAQVEIHNPEIVPPAAAPAGNSATRANDSTCSSKPPPGLCSTSTRHGSGGCAVGEVVNTARAQLSAEPLRQSVLGDVQLEDWIVPLTFEAKSLRPFAGKQPRRIFQVTEDRTADISDDDLPRRPDAGFFGRDETVFWIWDNVEPIAGFPAGTESAWQQQEQTELADFLGAAAERGAKFC